MLIIDCNDEASSYLGYVPNQHTVIYFPLTDNVVDKVQNLTLSNTGTKETLGRTFNTTVDYSDNSKISNAKYISIWLKINSGLNGTSCCTQLFDVGQLPISYCTSHSQSQFRNAVHFQNTSSSRPYAYPGITQGSRYHLAVGFNNGTVTMWCNGNKTVIGNNCKTSGGGGELIRIQGAGLNITLSDLIMEDEQPAETDILKYFNMVKKNYGLT